MASASRRRVAFSKCPYTLLVTSWRVPANRMGRAGPAEPNPYAHRTRGSGDVLDHLDELVDGVSLSASELDEFSDFLDDGAAFGCPGDGDSAAAAKLEQPFVLEQP